jgi:hypothetical protein
MWILERLYKYAGLKELENAENALRSKISRESDARKKRELEKELAALVAFKNLKKNDT